MDRFRTSRTNAAAKARAEHDARMSAITTQMRDRNNGTDNQVWEVRRGNAVIGTIQKFDDDNDTTNPYKAFTRSGHMIAVYYGGGSQAFLQAVAAVANA